MQPIPQCTLDLAMKSTHGNTLGTRRLQGILYACLVALAFACEHNPDVDLNEVRQLQEQGRFAETILPLERLLDESPDEYELNRRYGVALLSTGQPAPAIWPLQKAAQSPNGSLEDALNLGRAHFEGGSAEEAQAVASELVERSPELLEARMLRIKINKKLSDHEAALEDLEFILSYLPEDTRAHLQRAEMLLLLDRPDEAEEAVDFAEQVLADSMDAEGSLGRFCAFDATLVFERGGEDQIEQAMEIWQRCLEEYPANPLVVSEAINFLDAHGERGAATQALRNAADIPGSAVSFRVGLAQRLAALGEHEEAEKYFTDATSQPGGAAVWVPLIEYYGNRHDWPKALKAMETYLDTLPQPGDRERVHYADLLIRAGEFDAAEKAILQVEKPEFVSLLTGRMLLLQKRPKEALVHLQDGIRLWPDNAVARQLAGEAAEQLGDYGTALDAYINSARIDSQNWEVIEWLAKYFEAAGQTQPLAQLVQRYADLKPRDPRGHQLMIEIATWSKRPGLAVSSLVALAKLPGMAEQAIALQAHLVALENPKRAVKVVNDSKIDLTAPRSLAVLSEHVTNLATLNRHEEAISITRAAVNTNESASAAHEIHASALAAAGMPSDEVRRSLNRALELEPGRASVLTAHGDLSAAAGETEEAIEYYDRATASAPNVSLPAWSAIRLLDDGNNSKEVDRRLTLLLGVHWNHAGAASLLARRMALNGDNLEEAQRLARRAVKFSGGADAMATLGLIHLELGDPEAAIGPLRESLSLRPDSPSTRYQFGRALAQSGDREGARKQLEAALAGPDFPEEAKARAELARLDS